MFDEYSNTLSSKMAYLFGVNIKYFELCDNQNKSKFDIEIFDKFESNKSTRIVRNLSILRNRFMQDTKKIDERIVYDICSIDRIEDLIPQNAIISLKNDGIDIVKVGQRALKYIVDLNEHIQRHIYDIRDVFPDWLPFEYVKDLFIMPGGAGSPSSLGNVKNLLMTWHKERKKFPYQCYYNRPFNSAFDGNILANDRLLVSTMYKLHGKEFTDLSKVVNAPTKQTVSVAEFLSGNKRTEIIVDCENTDPYLFYSMYLSVKKNGEENIKKIVFIDDPNTSDAWEMISKNLHINVEHKIMSRIVSNKSIVDVSLSAYAVREIYKEQIDSFILCSSDSDFWGLVSVIEEANWLIMLKKDSSAYNFREMLAQNDIQYCYIDSYGDADADKLKTATLLSGAREYMKSRIHININEILEEIEKRAYANFTDEARTAFKSKYIDKMKLCFAPDGELFIEIGNA